MSGEKPDPMEERLTSIEQAIGRLSRLMVDKHRRRIRHSDSSGSNLDSDEGSRRRYNTRRDDDRGLKLDVPEFGEKTDPKSYLDWIQRAERIFEYKGYDDHKKFKISVLKLTKYASLWYEGLKAQRRREGRDKISTWSKFKKYLDHRFLPPTYLQDNYNKMNKLKQGALSVHDYIDEFEKLTILCDIQEVPEQKMARFLNGLNKNIANIVELHPCFGFDEMCKLAIKCEKQVKGNGSSSKISSMEDEDPSEISTSSFTPMREFNVSASSTKTEGKRPMRSKDNLKCFKCHGYGHVRSECPSQRALSTVEAREYQKEWLEKNSQSMEKLDQEDEMEVIDTEHLEGDTSLIKHTMFARKEPLSKAEEKPQEGESPIISPTFYILNNEDPNVSGEIFAQACSSKMAQEEKKQTNLKNTIVVPSLFVVSTNEANKEMDLDGIKLCLMIHTWFSMGFVILVGVMSSDNSAFI